MKEFSVLFYSKNHIVNRVVMDYLRTYGFSYIKTITNERDLVSQTVERLFSILIIDICGLHHDILTEILSYNIASKTLILTSDTTTTHIQHLQSLVVDSIIIKPFTFKTFETKISKLLK